MPAHRRRGSSHHAIPDVMEAAAINRFGPPSVLSRHQLPVPRPSPREVLIALEWAGVGSWDASIRDGSWMEGKRPTFPIIPGVDGAGTVVAIGSRVRRIKVGDCVYAYEFGNKKGGFYAQFAVARSDHVARIPASLATREAAAVVTTGLTAMEGISRLRLRPRSTVLVFGASGAVGTIAVQMAKRRGAVVIASASGRRASRAVRALGADHVIDARRTGWIEQIRNDFPNGVDAVLALAGGDALEQCVDLVRTGGRVAYPNGVDPVPRTRSTIKSTGYDAVANPERFVELAAYVRGSGLRVPIAASFPLAHAAQTHRRLEAGQIIGRMVLRIPRSLVR